MNENVQLLASESVIRRFARYVSLSILSMLGVAVYYFTDTFFISDQIGPVGLASLNFAVPIYFAANAIGLLLGIGGATKYTIHKTRGDVFKGDQVYTNMMALSVVISVIFIMVGILFAPQIAELFGANHETLAPTTTYVMIVMIFTPCFMYSNIFVAFIRNDNSPMISTVCMVTGTILNIILDYIFIYPLHLGVTEAGGFAESAVKSSAALGVLLNEGIGDTIRVSVSGPPKDELIIAKQLLRSFDLADRVPDFVACPTCGRIQYDMLPLVKEMEDYLQSVRANITVAVMGCPVNGMQEASRADVGVAGGYETGMLFRKGKLVRSVPQAELGDALKDEIQKILREQQAEK